MPNRFSLTISNLFTELSVHRRFKSMAMNQTTLIHDVTPTVDELTGYINARGQACSLPQPKIHSTELSSYHIKVEGFIRGVRKSAERFFPHDTYRYKEVHALLLSWMDDDLGVVHEVQELEKVFRDDYCFTSVRIWEIPSLKPYSKLEYELYGFKKSYSTDENLLVVYYGGHGYLDNSRLWNWAANR